MKTVISLRVVCICAAWALALIALSAAQMRAAQQPGNVVSWGEQIIPVDFYDGKRIVEIAAGSSHSLALKSDGTMIAWGGNHFGQSAVPAGLSNVIQIAGGIWHSLALKSDGTVIAWGYNSSGQSTVPTGLNNALQIAAGDSHSLALKADGTVAAWGWNGYGQSTVPTGLSNVVQIAAGDNHSLARKSDGTLVAWGDNRFGQSTVPGGLSNVVQIDSGGNHSLALKSDGTVVAWGYNNSGQSTVPAGLSNVVQIAAGGSHSLALKSDGTVVAWGYNNSGQSTVPVGLSNVIQIAAGGNHSLALKSDGTVVAWGTNAYGESKIPAELSNIIQIAAGYTHSLALKSDGTVAAWGINGSGTVPAALTNVIQIAPGSSYNLALKSDGTVVAWGVNSFGQTTIPAGLSNVTQIAAGDSHSLALKNDGTVVAWGNNGDGQSKVPTGLSNVVQIAGGAYHSLALKSNGTVVVWGWNSYGQSTVPAGLSNVIQIAGGGEHSVALKSDGTVVAWGRNSFGQSTVPAGLINVVQIAAGGNHTLALKNDGTVVVWGDNSYGLGTIPAGLTNVVQIAAGANHSLALVAVPPAPPTIMGPPPSRTVTAGQSTTFTVGATGNPAPTYQWRLNGVNISGATNTTFTISNAQLTNAGYYSVVVSNSIAQVTSAAAKLTVLSNLDTVLPALPTYTTTPAEPGKDSLVFITHGRTPTAADWPWQVAWLNQMKNSIKQNVEVAGNWMVIEYEWEAESQHLPTSVLGYARQVGAHVGNEIVYMAQFTHIHFIAHSAGSELIEEASRIIKAKSPNTTIHTTFLDPYTGVADGNRLHYGENSNWSENYFSFSPDTGDEVFRWTFGSLPHAYNVEVTWLDPAKTLTPQYSSSQNSTTATLTPFSYAASSTHAWPIGFYQNTIPPILSDRLPGYESYGFSLSKEGGGWANRSLYVVGNSPPHVLAAQTGIPQGSIPIITGSSYNFTILPHPVGQTGLVQFNTSGFTATTGTAPFSPQLTAKDSSIQTNFAAANAPMGSPAWTSIPVDVTSNVNFVTFNVEFTSQSGAVGLLTVYWNDEEIGQIDERDALPGVQSYTFAIASAFFDRSNSLGFRLDQFSSVASIVNVTNVATGFGGLTVAPKLTIAKIPGSTAPVLTLKGAVSYTYLVEASADLVNWEPIAAVTLDTGVTANLGDPSAAGLQMQFYRAVSP